MRKAFLYRVKGRVQGVGFRYFVYKKAISLSISGYVKNLLNGDVEVWAEGEDEKLNKLELILKKGPVLAHVTELLKEERKPQNFKDFQITY